MSPVTGNVAAIAASTSPATVSAPISNAPTSPTPKPLAICNAVSNPPLTANVAVASAVSAFKIGLISTRPRCTAKSPTCADFNTTSAVVSSNTTSAESASKTGMLPPNTSCASAKARLADKLSKARPLGVMRDPKRKRDCSTLPDGNLSRTHARVFFTAHSGQMAWNRSISRLLVERSKSNPVSRQSGAKRAVPPTDTVPPFANCKSSSLTVNSRPFRAPAKANVVMGIA